MRLPLPLRLGRTTTVLSIGILILNIGISIATTLLSVYLNTLGYSGIGIGLINAASITAMSFASLLTGRISDVIGRHSLIVISCLLTAVVGIVIYITNDPLIVALMIVLNGVAFGLNAPALSALISESEPMTSLTTAFAVFYTAALMGHTFGAMLSGFFSKLYGFPFLFLLLAIFSIMAALFIWRLLWEPYPNRVVEEAMKYALANPLKDFYELIRGNRSFLFFVVAIALHSLSFHALYPYISLYAVTDFRFDYAQTSTIISMWYIGLLLMQIPFGKLADKKGPYSILLFHLILSSAIWAIYPFSMNFLGAIVIMFIFGIIGSMDMPARRVITFELSAEGKVTLTMGTVDFIAGLMGIVGYVAGGLAWDYSSHISPFLFAALANIVGIISLMHAKKVSQRSVR